MTPAFSPLQYLTRVTAFLDKENWTRVRIGERFFVYEPPRAKKSTDHYQLYVPKDPAAIDFTRSIQLCIEAIASYYGSAVNSVEALMLPESEVVSVRLAGPDFGGGAAPFPQFERTIDHFKRMISKAAGFVVTDDPILQSQPPAATHFINDCWFLQTARGSFIVRVALPASGDMKRDPQYSLIERPRARELVSSTLRECSSLIGNRVLENDRTLFTKRGFAEVRALVSVAVLEEASRLLTGAQAESIDFRFNRSGAESRIAMMELTPQRLERLDRFIDFAREQVEATFDLDVTGRVFQAVRPRNPQSSGRTLVGIVAQYDGRQHDVTVKVDPDDLGVFLEHFQSQKEIRVRGRARRLRTQLRIEDAFQYIELR